MGESWCSALQSQPTTFSMQNAMCRVYLLVANVNFSLRTALPVTQPIGMGASCFGLAGKCDATQLHHLLQSTMQTWKLSFVLPARLFPVLQTNSWLVRWQCGFHLQLEDRWIWKLFWKDDFILNCFGIVSKRSQDQRKHTGSSVHLLAKSFWKQPDVWQMWVSAHSQGVMARMCQQEGWHGLRGLPTLLGTGYMSTQSALDWWSFCVDAGGWRLILAQCLPPRCSTSQVSRWYTSTYFILQLRWARGTYPAGYLRCQAWHFLTQLEGSRARVGTLLVHPNLCVVWRGHHGAEIPARSGQALRKWRVTFPAEGPEYRWKKWPSISSQ